MKIKTFRRHAMYLFLATASVFTHASQGQEVSVVNTSAVDNFHALKQSGEMTLESMASEYVAKDEGGLSILQSRFRSTENLFNFVKQLTPGELQKITVCKRVLASMAYEVKDIQTRFNSLVGYKGEHIPVYGVIGAGNTAATADPRGVVLGLELICSSNQSEAEIRDTFRSYIAHELVHAQQYRVTTRQSFDFTLLEIAILEGSADFVAELLLGAEYRLDDKRVEFGVNNEGDLWPGFKQQMNTQKYAPWLYTRVDNQPMDMGYWMGYEISRRYIENGGQLNTLLKMEDAKAIFDSAQR